MEVAYHMTSLAPESDAHLEAFGEGYQARLAGWADTLAPPGRDAEVP